MEDAIKSADAAKKKPQEEAPDAMEMIKEASDESPVTKLFFKILVPDGKSLRKGWLAYLLAGALIGWGCFEWGHKDEEELKHKNESVETRLSVAENALAPWKLLAETHYPGVPINKSLDLLLQRFDSFQGTLNAQTEQLVSIAAATNASPVVHDSIVHIAFTNADATFVHKIIWLRAGYEDVFTLGATSVRLETTPCAADFPKKRTFLVLYVPHSAVAFTLIAGLPAIWKSFVAPRLSNTPKGYPINGETYIYYENDFTQDQLRQLTSSFRDKKLNVEFRGLAYASANASPSPSP